MHVQYIMLSKQAIYCVSNTKEKLHRAIASICFDITCRLNHVTPKYVKMMWY